MSRDEICFMSAVELRDRIRARELSPVEAVEAHLQRIDEINPAINAYVAMVPERALDEARAVEAAIAQGDETGALAGVPFSCKDLVGADGMATTHGSKLYAENQEPDATAVARMRRAGGILLGKTNTPEFGLRGTTENKLFGATHNPWKLERTSGGSSGGAGAAGSAGLAPLNIGTDGGGSIRIPSCFCGLFGVKATFGRVPISTTDGSNMLSHLGPMTRTVADAALMMDVIVGPDGIERWVSPAPGLSYLETLDEKLPPLKIGWATSLGYGQATAVVDDAFKAALPVFEDMGHTVEEARNINLPNLSLEWPQMVAAKVAALHGPLVEQRPDDCDTALVQLVQLGKTLKATDYVRFLNRQAELCQAAAAIFEQYDILLTPTVSVPAFPIGRWPREINGAPAGPMDWLPYTYPFNFSGHPAASIPMGWTDDDLPMGLQIVGRRFEEETLLRLARLFEQARPWADRRPTYAE